MFLAQVTVSTRSTPPVHVLALLDSEANSCFMDRNFAQAHQISLRKLPCPTSVIVIDGRPIAPGNIIEETKPVNIVLDNLACVVSFVERQAQHRPDRLKKPRTGSVGTDRAECVN